MKKLFTLFAGMIIASAAWAQSNAVYEPLIVTDGFNRDVIAEDVPYTEYSVSYYQPNNISDYKKMHNHATKEVVRLTNETNKNLTDEQKDYLANNTGWPNDYGNPGDRNVECISESYPGLFCSI